MAAVDFYSTLQKIISSGEDGAASAVRDWAKDYGVARDGWCPRGQHAEFWPYVPPPPYRETQSAKYGQCNKWNVRDSDATVIFTLTECQGRHCQRIVELVTRQRKPCLHLMQDAVGGAENADRLVQFIRDYQVRKLHVAGSRRRDEPGIVRMVLAVLERAFFAEGRPPLRRERLRTPDAMFSETFREKLLCGKYSSWAANLNETQLQAVLWAVAEFGWRSCGPLELMAQVPARDYPAQRAIAALKALADFSSGGRITLDELLDRIRNAGRELNQRRE